MVFAVHRKELCFENNSDTQEMKSMIDKARKAATVLNNGHHHHHHFHSSAQRVWNFSMTVRQLV